jgi:hypothetical protein
VHTLRVEGDADAAVLPDRGEGAEAEEAEEDQAHGGDPGAGRALEAAGEHDPQHHPGRGGHQQRPRQYDEEPAQPVADDERFLGVHAAGE